ncbi:MAG: hypothetical protein KY461_13470 [Actinobacteria bacterium]|nr:hypothetical protein [Actinomycetota bacterium]
MARLRVEVEGTARSLERDDVVAWAGLGAGAAERDDDLRRAAVAYVRAHPRPAPDAQGGVNVPARQRMALLRRLAAGPATRLELLATMRGAAGYVGGDDWRNRLDELRGRGKRGGGHAPLPIAVDEERDVYRLTEPIAVLSDGDRETIGRLKASLADAGDETARALLESLLPGVPEVRDQAGSSTSSNASQRPSPRTADNSRR